MQDSTLYTATVAYDRALSARAGGGFQVNAARDAARDPGYSTASGGATVYAFREIGKTTAVMTLGFSHSAAIAGPGDDTGYLNGWFTGNGATEFGAAFTVDTFATPAQVEYTLKGAIVGKKDP